MSNRIVRALLPLVLFATPLFAASNDIFVTGLSTGSARASTMMAFSHTVASGTNRYLLVGISISNNATVSSVTFGGTALTFVGGASTTGSNERVELWQMLSPPAGTAFVFVTLTNSADFVAGAISFINVNQTTPHRGFNSAIGQGTSASLVVPTFDRDMVIDTIVAAGGATSLTPGASQVQEWDLFTGPGAGDAIGGGSMQPGSYGSPTGSAGSVTMQWTLGKSRRWAIGAVSLVPDVYPTAVDALHGTVTRCGDTAEIGWTSEREHDNLGFHIVREDARGRMTRSPLIAGTFFTTGRRSLARDYRWVDRDRGAQTYWIEDVDARGRATLHGPLLEMQGGCTGAVAPPSPAIGELARPATARQVVATATRAPITDASTQFTIAGTKAIRISVDREGWYRVTRAQLLEAGLDPAAKPDKLQLYADGVEVAMIANAAGIEFYGSGQDTPWSASRVYWLVAGARPGKRVARIDATASGAATGGHFMYAVERHDRNIYGGEIVNGEADNFFGPIVSGWAAATQTLTLQHVDTGASENATIAIAIQGVRGEHAVDVTINGHSAGSIAFGVRERVTRTLDVPASWLVEGENTIVLSVASLDDLSAVESVRITYPHTYELDGGALAFSAIGGHVVSLPGNARVFDTTDPANVREIASPSFVAPGFGARTFFASATPLAPLAVTANVPSSWNEKQNAAAVAIITTRALAPALEPLRARRAAQYGSAAIIDVEDLFDEFNFGAKSPRAIRDFVLASRKWKTPPRYIVLAGDASFDPRGYLGIGDFDLVPTKIAGTALLETASDDWFTDLDGDGAADTPIGRIAVRSASEASAYVAKLLAYESASVPPRRALIVNDTDSEYDFAAMGDTVASTLAPSFDITRASTRAATLSALHDGPSLAVYFGHGSVMQWSEQPLLTNADVPLLANGTRLPFVIGMTCLGAFFHDVYTTSLGETLVNAQGGGAIAVWTSSGLTFPPAQIVVANALARSLTSGTALGDAIVAAKKTIGDRDVKATWILLGDPAMQWK